MKPERFHQTEISLVDNLSVVNGRMNLDAAVK
jgi:hypothetical protein